MALREPAIMVLYHFTCAEFLKSIMRHWLCRGDVRTKKIGPLYETNAVWLTTDPQPKGHGLGLPGALTEEDRLRHFEAFGTMPPKGSRYPDKRAVRITVNIPKGDPRLQRWTRWARKHCEPGVYDNLARADGSGHKTWWLYFGPIAPNQFRDIDMDPSLSDAYFGSASGPSDFCHHPRRRGDRVSAHMNRRQSITLPGGAAACPLAAPAQQAGKIYRIGFLANDPPIPTPPAGQAFLDGLRESGFIEGKNVIIERRFA